MKKRKISMAETAMIQERTFIQPIDISEAITLEDLRNLNPQDLWNVFKEVNKNVQG